MTTLFISDLHLQEERPDITRAFFDFLSQKAANAHQLYILGDFFEVWIGDDGITPFQQRIIDALNRLSDHCELYFMHGNRDFLIGNHFAALSNATLLNDPTIISLQGTQTLLMHGDSLCTEDKDYMAFRNMVRDSAWQKEFLGKPITERQAIAQQLRQQSQEQTATKQEYITDVCQDEVVNTMIQNGCPLLIHGHTHRPARHKVQLGDLSGERIVLGDWGASGWYVSATQQGIELQEFHPH